MTLNHKNKKISSRDLVLNNDVYSHFFINENSYNFHKILIIFSTNFFTGNVVTSISIQDDNLIYIKQYLKHC